MKLFYLIFFCVGIDSVEQNFGVEPLITAGDMATATDDHLGVMAYAAQIQSAVENGGRRKLFDPNSAHISKLDSVPLRKPVDLKVCTIVFKNSFFSIIQWCISIISKPGLPFAW